MRGDNNNGCETTWSIFINSIGIYTLDSIIVLIFLMYKLTSVVCPLNIFIFTIEIIRLLTAARSTRMRSYSFLPLYIHMETPDFPARPVLPDLCIYDSISCKTKTKIKSYCFPQFHLKILLLFFH